MVTIRSFDLKRSATINVVPDLVTWTDIDYYFDSLVKEARIRVKQGWSQRIIVVAIDQSDNAIFRNELIDERDYAED